MAEQNEPSLAEVMQRLYDQEISCGVSSFWDGGWAAWIGTDWENRQAGAMGFRDLKDGGAEIARWLLDAAAKLQTEWTRRAS
ncbi:MAG TPA: hypothetical protein VHZ26_09085 [Caulobacteraceae bacterium]|jgi:hypothetical protein|nr:hypothetical protein [Caulobacteraceae bacterium]